MSHSIRHFDFATSITIRTVTMSIYISPNHMSEFTHDSIQQSIILQELVKRGIIPSLSTHLFQLAIDLVGQFSSISTRQHMLTNQTPSTAIIIRVYRLRRFLLARLKKLGGWCCSRIDPGNSAIWLWVLAVGPPGFLLGK